MVNLYCRKYSFLLKPEDLEENSCLSKFFHGEEKGICPNVENLDTSTPYWKEVYTKEKYSSGIDILTNHAKAIDGIKRAFRELNGEGKP